MDWIAWDDSLDTGHTRMDAEHKQLAQLFNRLRDAVDSGAERAACAEVLDGIISHAQAHFDLEQQMMAQHAYPKATQHAAEHAMLLRQARDYRDSFDVNTAEARAAAMKFPEVWLAYHILFSDKELAAFIAHARGDSGKP